VELEPAPNGSSLARITLLIHTQDGDEVVKGEGTGVFEG